MSETIRQNKLFAAEDWKVVYSAFQNVSLQAYDYESIYNALVDYLRKNNPDEFNNYVEHTEMMAHINMLAYLGQSLAFRLDLNAREAFFDTAERRESIIKLAKSLAYKVKRNRTAHGKLKITSVTTTEPVLDSRGQNLANQEIQWNQNNDSNWYDKFIRVINSSLVSVNRFGEPIKQEDIDGVRTDIYAVNTVSGAEVTYPFSSNVNGKAYSFEIVSSDIDEVSYFEDTPNPFSTFNMIYQNDDKGNSSPNTGFFVQFKEGSLRYDDTVFDNPQPDREYLIDVENINQTDVWVQELNTDGSPKHEWVEIPSLVGQTVIYNSVFLKQRKIYGVDTVDGNRAKILFSDGNFGDVPVGTYRMWYRVSKNESYIIRPSDIVNKTVTISYIGNDNQPYQMTIKFSLTQEVSNAEAEESSADIAKNAPLLHYTQDRMINGEDYNVYPTTQTNIIKKLKSVNRTHAGHSRYIDVSDPTGSHSNVTVFGGDGYLYHERQNKTSSEYLSDNTNYNTMVYSHIEQLMNTYEFNMFYYSLYRQEILKDQDDFLTAPTNRYEWRTLPTNEYNTKGYIYDNNISDVLEIGGNANTDFAKLIRMNTKILFVDGYGNEEWVTLVDFINDGQVNPATAREGNITLSNNIKNGWYIKEIIPGIRLSLTDSESSNFANEMTNNRSFGVRYDFINDEWVLILQDNIINTTDDFDLNQPTLNNPDNRWLVKGILNTQDGKKIYNFTGRGMRFVFGADKEVRFFFKTTSKVVDSETGKVVSDYIRILKNNSDRVNLTYKNFTARGVVGTFTATPPSTTIDTSVMLNGDFGTVEILDSEQNVIPFSTNGNNLTVNVTESKNLRITKEISVVDSNIPESVSLKRSYKFSIKDTYIRPDGMIDFTKVIVMPFDSDGDGVADFPLAFEDIVDMTSMIFFKSYTDYDNSVYDRVDNTIQKINDVPDNITEGNVYFCEADIQINNVSGTPIQYSAGKFYKGVDDVNGISQNQAYELENNSDGSSTYSYAYGRSFNTDDPFNYEWKHYASDSERIDPSISNLIDMYVLLSSYDVNVRTWLKTRGELEDFPVPPTSSSLKGNLKALETNKSTSDQIIYIPANYKLLFGAKSLPEYRAKFKVVKMAGSQHTDNEIKSKVIAAIDEYFHIDNWDFGDAFYFSELNAFIHKKLVGIVSSVLLVPENVNSTFGDLLEIKSEPNELFLSTATVEDIEIVKTYTDYNLKRS